ncbi:MAG: hypothetical protein JKX73_04360 [Flavobacteriales bacterium]|nr:hypothetical protein [Flavobacteriales bacterium]
MAPLDDRQMEKFLSNKINAQQNSVELTEDQLKEVLSMAPLREKYYED